MTFKELMNYWKSDYLRHRNFNKHPLHILFFTPGFTYCFYMRLCKYLKTSKYHIIYIPLFVVCRILLKQYEFRFGIKIPYTTSIGHGLYIGNFGGIVIHPSSVLGDNITLSRDVTIGPASTGAKKIEGIKVGSNVSIGENAVVTDDLPDNAIAEGKPARVIAFNKE